MLRNFLLITVSILLVSCATEVPKPHFVDAATQEMPPPSADKAQIIFLEPINATQGYFPVGIFKISGDSRTLLATTGSHTKVALMIEPGHHIFMANHSGGNAHFLEANVEAGKRYYVLLRFIYAGGFQLRPLRTTGASDYTIHNKDFYKWIKESRFVEKTADAEVFYGTNKIRVDKSQADGWKKWLAKTAEDRAELTLNPEDAVKE